MKRNTALNLENDLCLGGVPSIQGHRATNINALDDGTRDLKMEYSCPPLMVIRARVRRANSTCKMSS